MLKVLNKALLDKTLRKTIVKDADTYLIQNRLNVKEDQNTFPLHTTRYKKPKSLNNKDV
jgi:hypothetical protein